MRRLTFQGALLGSLLLLVAMQLGAAVFPETVCPPVGAAVGCGIVISVNPGGTLTGQSYGGAAGGNYEGAGGDDVLVGVVNNTGTSLASFTLTGGGGGAFGFDGDGPCTGYTPAPPMGCGPDASGYGGGGPDVAVTFSNNTGTSLTVNLVGGLPAGGKAWFALEGRPTLANIGVPPGPVPNPNPNPTPEPSTLALMGLGAAVLVVRRRKAA